MKRFLFLILIASFYCFDPQQGKSDCRDLVLKYYETMNVSKLPDVGHSYFMSLETESVFRDTNEAPRTKSHDEYLITRDQLQYKGDQMTIYQDNKYIFVILHPGKTVIWSNKTEHVSAISRLPLALLFRDSILSQSTFSCTNILNKNGKTFKKATMDVPLKFQKISSVKRMVCLLDSAGDNMKQVDVFYTDSYKLVKTTNVFNEINFNYTKVPVQPVRNLVLSPDNRLLPKYKGYRLLDNRNKNDRNKNNKK